MTGFFVPGIPVPKGSAKSFVYRDKRTGKHRAATCQDNAETQKPWAAMIGLMARENGCTAPASGPISVGMQFSMPRPKSHFRTGKNSGMLRPDAPEWHDLQRDDLDKLVRCVLDALTGIVYHDDGQVAKLGRTGPEKKYGEIPGVWISIEML